MHQTLAVACSCIALTACTAQKTNPTPEATLPSTVAPSSTTALPTVAIDENGFLNATYGPSGEGGHRYMAQSPAALVTMGYGVCDHMKRGWAWTYIKASLRDPSIYEDIEPIATSAATHLCGLTEDQLREYINAHPAASR